MAHRGIPVIPMVAIQLGDSLKGTLCIPRAVTYIVAKLYHVIR